MAAAIRLTPISLGQARRSKRQTLRRTRRGIRDLNPDRRLAMSRPDDLDAGTYSARAFHEGERQKPRPLNEREFLYHPEGGKTDPNEPLAEEPAPVMRRVKARRI
jgi:hypothetical protein